MKKARKRKPKEHERYVWVEIEPGHKRLVDTQAEPVQSTTRTRSVGEIHETWEEERYRKLYGEKMLVCEDLKNKAARSEWGRYKILPDGREGPLPFKSKSERREYCARFGFRESGGWG